jgi:predicted ribosomally synthesized peptide with SipW-like signal peptide
MKKILLSLGTIGVVSALAIASTGAFFSDNETSAGNTFTAGAIDLKVDSQQHYNNAVCVNGVWQLEPNQTATVDQYPVIGSQCDGTWSLVDLLPTSHFFNFGDVKPGDKGEDTVSLHIDNNAAWACADIKVTKNDENVALNPELKAGDVADAVSLFDGELAQNINIFAWNDNGANGGVAGDNIWQAGEPALYGPASAFSTIGATTTLALADPTINSGTPLAGGSTNYVGVAWCAGTMTANAGVITCNGGSMGNNAQTDSMTADIAFRVEQARNNSAFRCNPPVVVTANDLANNLSDVISNPAKWFMYNDDTDTIDNTLGVFVTGPGTPLLGTKSLEFTLGANPQSRKNIATYQFTGTPLSSISAMSFGVYSHGGSGGASVNESPFLAFNVDFNGTDTWQKRLVYVPSANGAVSQDTWNNNDAIQGGNALWTWSGYVANGNKWPDNNVNEYRTWNDIKASFPGVRVRVTDSWLGVRVGEPGPTGYIGNVDKFSITISGVTKTFDFGN